VSNSSLLSQPLELPCGVVLPNRLAKSAMTEGLADSHNQPTEAHARLYARWARGGMGLSLTGNVMVDRRHLERAGNVAITSRKVHPALRAWATAGVAQGGALWMQIGHAGRQTPRFINSSPHGASAGQLAIAGQFGASQAYSGDELDRLVARFGDAAWVAKQAGFSGVQIHAAHGFLISEFLSPRLNRRHDRWGGELKNRARLLLDIVDATRAAVGPHFPVAVKLNSEDFHKGGFSLQECLEVVKWLSDRRIDLLEVTGGSYEQPQMMGHGRITDDGYRAEERLVSQRTVQREAYFLNYAKVIRQTTHVPVMVTGGFRSRAFMLQALAARELDLIGLARPLIMDPDLPRKLMHQETESAVCIEKELMIKPAWLGPRSPFFTWRLINIQGQQAWFYHQLQRMGQGLPADRRMGLLSGLVRHELSEWLAAYRLSPRQGLSNASNTDCAAGMDASAP
jgi:2,4-dienoyl-CoA reductase-like NADH-dependent reductase (Old Yellow Enzyme family)